MGIEFNKHLTPVQVWNFLLNCDLTRYCSCALHVAQQDFSVVQRKHSFLNETLGTITSTILFKQGLFKVHKAWIVRIENWWDAAKRFEIWAIPPSSVHCRIVQNEFDCVKFLGQELADMVEARWMKNPTENISRTGQVLINKSCGYSFVNDQHLFSPWCLLCQYWPIGPVDIYS